MRLEVAFIEYCLSDLSARHDVRKWAAEYIPTAKNGQVADFWLRQGFDELSAINGCKRYSRSVDASAAHEPTFVTIEEG